MGNEYNRKASQFHEVVTAANLDPVAFQTVTKKLDEILDNRNSIIQDLQYGIARATKTHNDTIRTYVARLTELGIPDDELQFPFMPSTTAPGPAGLVVKKM